MIWKNCGKLFEKLHVLLDFFCTIHACFIRVFVIFALSFISNLISEKSKIWFILIPPAKYQPPNPSIKATNCMSRFCMEIEKVV
jgi:hypothetical protein